MYSSMGSWSPFLNYISYSSFLAKAHIRDSLGYSTFQKIFLYCLSNITLILTGSVI